MPSVTDGGSLRVPEELRADRELFLNQASPWIESGRLDGEFLDRIDRFALLLYERIPTLSLIGKRDRATIYTRHVLDSLNPLSLFEEAPECFLDIGSGGGFPGIPLALAWPQSRVVLLESRERKAAFLERTLRDLALPSGRVVCERLHEHVRKSGPVYDALFIRAVAEPAGLIEEAGASCQPGARWVYFLGAGIDREALRAALGATGRSGVEAAGLFGNRLYTGSVA
jgi:16S rRNA (guanine527-N7)-methyltransferase